MCWGGEAMDLKVGGNLRETSSHVFAPDGVHPYGCYLR